MNVSLFDARDAGQPFTQANRTPDASFEALLAQSGIVSQVQPDTVSDRAQAVISDVLRLSADEIGAGTFTYTRGPVPSQPGINLSGSATVVNGEAIAYADPNALSAHVAITGLSQSRALDNIAAQEVAQKTFQTMTDEPNTRGRQEVVGEAVSARLDPEYAFYTIASVVLNALDDASFPPRYDRMLSVSARAVDATARSNGFTDGDAFLSEFATSKNGDGGFRISDVNPNEVATFIESRGGDGRAFNEALVRNVAVALSDEAALVMNEIGR